LSSACSRLPPPHLIIIDRVDDQFRYRLVGTAVAEQFGHDLTGRYVGFYVSPAKYIAALRAIYQRVFTTGRPKHAAMAASDNVFMILSFSSDDPENDRRDESEGKMTAPRGWLKTAALSKHFLASQRMKLAQRAGLGPIAKVPNLGQNVSC
jgi:hypothetical protein